MVALLITGNGVGVNQGCKRYFWESLGREVWGLSIFLPLCGRADHLYGNATTLLPTFVNNDNNTPRGEASPTPNPPRQHDIGGTGCPLAALHCYGMVTVDCYRTWT